MSGPRGAFLLGPKGVAFRKVTQWSEKAHLQHAHVGSGQKRKSGMRGGLATVQKDSCKCPAGTWVVDSHGL